MARLVFRDLPGGAQACHLNLTLYGDTKPSMWRDVYFSRNVILYGNPTMKLFGSSLRGQAIKAAGIGAALMLSVSAGLVQSSGPFAVFFFSSRRRHTRSLCDWSSDVCSSD